MDHFFQTVKKEGLKKYDKYLKSRVTKSINQIESTGYGKFILDSGKSFLVWLVTCSVVIFTKLQIFYEKYQASQVSNPALSTSDKSVTQEVKVYETWNNYDQQRLSVGGISLDQFIHKLNESNLTTDPDQNIRWYTLISKDNIKAIVVASVFSPDYQDKLKVKPNTQLKYLSAIKKQVEASPGGDSPKETDKDKDKGTDPSQQLVSHGDEKDITSLINLYSNAEGVTSLDVADLSDLDGTPLCRDGEILLLIDNDANTVTLKPDDVLSL